MRIGADTDEFAASHRLRRWRELMCDTYIGMDCRTEYEDFRYVVDGYRIGQYSLIRETSAGHDAVRRPVHINNDGIERFYIAFQSAGCSLVQQGDREAVLESGRVCFHDSTRPFRTRMGPGNDVLWLGVPKRPFVERFLGTEDRTAVAFRPSRPVVRQAFELWSNLEELSMLASLSSSAQDQSAEALDLLASATMLSTLEAGQCRGARGPTPPGTSSRKSAFGGRGDTSPRPSGRRIGH